MRFLGDTVSITSVLIHGEMIMDVEAVYSDSSGRVHGTVKHRFSASELPDSKVCKDFILAVMNHVKSMHFDGVEVQSGREIVGIGEKLGGPDGQG